MLYGRNNGQDVRTSYKQILAELKEIEGHQNADIKQRFIDIFKEQLAYKAMLFDCCFDTKTIKTFGVPKNSTLLVTPQRIIITTTGLKEFMAFTFDRIFTVHLQENQLILVIGENKDV